MKTDNPIEPLKALLMYAIAQKDFVRSEIFQLVLEASLSNPDEVRMIQEIVVKKLDLLERLVLRVHRDMHRLTYEQTCAELRIQSDEALGVLSGMSENVRDFMKPEVPIDSKLTT